jgi:hypothetical protein
VTDKRSKSPLASAPLVHVPRKPPQGGIPPQRLRNPIAQAPPPPTPARVPEQRPVGAVPNPRKPKLVRDVDGGILQDLFAIFPDLPRPPRPAARVRLRPVWAARRSKRT